MSRTSILASALLVAAACAGSEMGAPGSTTQPTAPQPTGTTGPGATSTTVPSSSTTVVPRPGGDLVRCQSPEGFAVSAPAGWATNAGDVVPACTLFNPDPFTVPPATDQRVAAISARVATVDFATAAQPLAKEQRRMTTAVQGRQAVRIAYRSSGEGLRTEGTPVTAYVIDLGNRGGRPASLYLDTVGTASFDYERNVAVLDRMFRTLELTDPAIETDPAVVAAYRGGGGGFTVAARSQEGEVCLRIPPGGEAVCTGRPAVDQVHTVNLRDLRDVVPAGVTGSAVWQVDLVSPDCTTHSYLPAPVPGTDVGAYAFHDSAGDLGHLVLYDIGGTALRTVDPGRSGDPARCR